MSAPQREIVLDHSDLDWFLDYPGGWAIARTKGSFYTQTTRGLYRLHKLLCPLGNGLLADHRNGDTLDCRRMNLRGATARQNSLNRARVHSAKSRFIGVQWHRQAGKWTAQIKDSSGFRWSIGVHPEEATAALIRDGVASQLHGEFVRLNFPDRLDMARQAAAGVLARIAKGRSSAD